MDIHKNYFIKDTFRNNPVNLSSEKENDEIFWNENNIRTSLTAQYYVYQLVHQVACKNNIKTILDIGCGIGSQINHFFGVGYNVFGIDQPHAVAYCKQNNKSSIYISDDFEKPTYEMKKHIKTAPLIVCADVIEHLNNPDLLLNYLKEFANKDTFIIISTPERDSKWGKSAIKSKCPYHIREWNLKEFQQYLTYSGFDIIQHKKVFSARIGFNIPSLLTITGKIIRFLPLKNTQVVITKIKQQNT